jgi:translocation and assembly module TamA
MRLLSAYKLTLACLLISASLLAHAKIKVVIEGVNDEAALNNIQARLGIMQVDESLETPRRHIRSLYIRGQQEIKEALQPFGYYKAEVESEISQSGKNWNIRYKVNLGTPVRITEVINLLEGPGAELPLFTKIQNNFTLKEAQQFNQILYDNYKKALLNTADIYGYFDARFITQQILIDPKANTAQIHLIFNTGRPYYYGHIQFESEYFSPKFLHRFLNIQPGQAYDENKPIVKP